jgi:hypothetical protein
MNRRFWIACVLVLLAGAAVLRAAESLRIVPIVHDDEVLISFELADAYTEELRQTISSGLRTTFTYDVELRMVVPAWFDRTVVASVVSISEQYDNLTRRHSLSRAIDGHVEQALVTEDEAVVKQWLTKLDRLPLSETSKLEPNRDYYVRISARKRPRGTGLLGFIDAVTGEATFTFIP